MALQSRSRNVTAVLGPTNTGKTHLAIERMLGHSSGMIGLPLRLLAREVYDKIVARTGPDSVALITGEEKIKPENPKYWVSTVEAMPRDIETDFLAIDEIQLAADLDRGHVFTERLLHARGRSETLLLGAGTMREAIDDLIPGANFISRPRLSKLTYAGQKKITRLPKRSAIVAFSAAEVYAIAELIRRQLGGAAVVLGALSPRTRNAQVALYQSGDVDYLVATDAIGMGLNLDVDHVAFSAIRKFDGHNHRMLTAGELGQIAGRAGRHMNDGTFGVTADVEPLEADLIERLESHTFDTIRHLQWRNPDLDFRSLDRLRESLRRLPNEPRLQRARAADDLLALEAVSAVREIADQVTTPAAVERLWEVAQVPDYRKISSQNHAELVATLFGFLMSDSGHIPEDWFAKQVAQADRTDGDIDTLANRLAHIRTWTFVSNRANWLADPGHWQGRTRAIEDSLSDALHEQLAQRFVDRRTSALMKGLRDKEDMTAEIGADGAIHVEKHYVGKLLGFRFSPDTQSDSQSVHGKAARTAAAHVLSKELGMRARRVASAKNDAFKLARNCRVQWRGEDIAKVEAGDDPLKPVINILSDEHLSGPDKDKVQARLDSWMASIVGERLKPLMDLKTAEDLTGLGKGIAFRLIEGFGSLKRETVADDMRQLDQPARAQLRKYGVRFGAFNIYLPLLLKPAAAELALSLWGLKNAAAAGLDPEALPEPPRPGLTSVTADASKPEAFYRVAGYHLCGPRAIRMDILERLADQIRPMLAWRVGGASTSPPKGSTGDGGFMLTPEMLSILGCSSEELSNVLKTLGFRSDKRPQRAIPTLNMPAPSPTVEAEAGAETAQGGTAQVADAVDAGSGQEALEDASAGAPSTSDNVEAPAAEAAETAAEPVVEAPVPTAEATSTEASDAAEPSTAAVEPAGDTSTISDAPSEAGAEAVTAAPQPEAEEKMIEVWRPRRRDRSDGGHRQGQRPQQEGRDRWQNRDRNRRDGRRDRGPRPAETPAQGTPATGEATTVPAAAEAGAAPQQAPGHREDRRPHRDAKPFHKRGAGGGGGGGDRNRDRDRDHREGRGDDRRRRDDRGRNENRSTGPGRKSGVDPDSPFAALSALKSQLEKQAKDRGSA